MKIIFMGNGPFAVPSLDRLIKSDHQICQIVTRPDFPSGKKKTITPGPVTQYAMTNQLEYTQPIDVNDSEVIEMLASKKADLLVVVDFGQILSNEALATSRLGGINIHASLLPKYRGAAPIAWAIWNGETQSGVSIIRMTPKMDAGGVLIKREEEIRPDDTAESLEIRLADLGAELVLESCDRLSTEENPPLLEQDPSQITKAPKLTKQHGRIDWSRSAIEIERQIRATLPWPVAYTTLEYKDDQSQKQSTIRLQLLKASVSDPNPEAPSQPIPGSILRGDSDRIEVQTSDGVLQLLEIKPAGKRAMKAEEFLRGTPVQNGCYRFTSE